MGKCFYGLLFLSLLIWFGGVSSIYVLATGTGTWTLLMSIRLFFSSLTLNFASELLAVLIWVTDALNPVAVIFVTSIIGLFYLALRLEKIEKSGSVAGISVIYVLLFLSSSFGISTSDTKSV